MVDSCNGYFTYRTIISELLGVEDGVVVSKCEPESWVFLALELATGKLLSSDICMRYAH